MAMAYLISKTAVLYSGRYYSDYKRSYFYAAKRNYSKRLALGFAPTLLIKRPSARIDNKTAERPGRNS
jgi:hypothetical protein